MQQQQQQKPQQQFQYQQQLPPSTPNKPVMYYPQQPVPQQQPQSFIQQQFLQQPNLKLQQQSQPQQQAQTQFQSQFQNLQIQQQQQSQQQTQKPQQQQYYQSIQQQPQQQQFIKQQQNVKPTQSPLIQYAPSQSLPQSQQQYMLPQFQGMHQQQIIMPRFVQSVIPAETCAILADVGGTNSRFSLKKFSKNTQQVTFEKTDIVTYNTQSRDFASFYAILEKFFKEEVVKQNIQPTIAILSFAGPPKNGEVIISNSPQHWPNEPIKSSEISKLFPQLRKCIFLNDFEAIGYAFSKKDQLDLCIIYKGKQKTDNSLYPMAVLGPGTGLGECIINPVSSKNNTQEYYVFPTEGGHATFAPTSQEEFEFAEYIKKEKNLPYVCNEVAFAGPALPFIYKFFRNKSHEHNKIEHELNDLKDKKEKGELDDPTHDSKFNQLIVQNGINEHDPVCYQTIKFLVKIMATEIGNFGIRAIARDGVFIVGSLINSLDKFIEKHYEEIFKPVYFNKDKMIPLLEEISVNIVKTNELGLRGCFYQAQKYAFEI